MSRRRLAQHRFAAPAGLRSRRARRPAGLLLGIGLALAGAVASAQTGDASRAYEEALARFNDNDLESAVVSLKDALLADPGLLPAHVLMARILLRIDEPAAAQDYLQRARRLGGDPNIVWPLQAQALYAQRDYRALLALSPREGLEAGPQTTVHLFRGRAHLELGEFERARAQFRAAAALTPGTPLPAVLLAVAALREGDLEAAEGQAAEALRIAPESTDAWNVVGDVAHVQGKLRQALDAYDRALERSAGHVDARISRAAIRLDLGALDEAGEDIARLRRQAPREPRAIYLQAVLLARRGEVDRAREALREAALVLHEMGIDEGDQPMQMVLLAGLASFELGNSEQAQGLLSRYVDRFPTQPGPRKLLGAILVRNKRPAEAIRVLEPALEKAPNDYRILSLLAAAYMQRARYDLAAGYLERAVALRGNDPGLRAEHALASIGRGLEAEGLRELTAVFEADPLRQGAVGIRLVSLQLARHDYAGALRTAQMLRAAKPRNVNVLTLVAAAELGLDRVDEARATLNEALDVDPTHLPARLNLGKLEALEGNFEGAKRIFEQVLHERPENTVAMVDLAAVEERLGRRDAAMRWLQKALVSDPRALRAALALVDLHLAAGDERAAMRVVEETESFLPEDPDLFAARARVHVAEGRSDLALGVYQRMSLLAGFDAEKLLRVARLQADAGAPEEALFSLHKALQSDSNHVPAKLLLVRLQLRTGKLEQARESVTQLLAVPPARADVLGVAGEVAMAGGDVDTAISHFTRAMELEPSSANALRVFRARLAGGAGAEAMQFLEEWADRHPRDVQARRALAEVELAAGHLAKARAHYEQALALRPTDAGMLNNLALILDAGGDPGALSLAERAAAAAPGDAAVLDTVGWILVRRGEPERGLGYLRDASSRAAGNPEIRYHIATALVALNRREEARRELELALETGRPFDGVGEARALLERLRR